MSVQTRGGQLSYLVSEKTVSDLPLNGRNYTDLVFLQPGVLSFPHRDVGSIVAHGLRREHQRPGPAFERVPARRHAA